MQHNRDYFEYTKRLSKQSLWKKLLNVQFPYQVHLRYMKLNKVLDIGCGIGRNLKTLHKTDLAIGIDHNPHSVQKAISLGLRAYIPEDFLKSKYAQKSSFNSLLFSHVLEHLTFDDAKNLVKRYLSFLKAGGKVIIITPQKAGFDSDSTHITMMDLPMCKQLLSSLNVNTSHQYSFPNIMGRIFKYNENITIGLMEQK